VFGETFVSVIWGGGLQQFESHFCQRVVAKDRRTAALSLIAQTDSLTDLLD